ncbi:carcinine transporter-like [Penaeus japonicus]|uniref:carcinine transporter-like n=1 Tax=Penaeus japonicus TaxID=27405 RepID=UPI001C711684|nr:carcinine transporter-like [Penaeus japonicus]
MVIKDFDSVFVHIGGFGRYQMLLFLVNCFMSAIASFVYFGQFFMTLTPPHWCAPPSDLASLNLTSEQVKRLTIPKDAHTGKYLECVRYQVDLEEVVENQTIWPDPSWPTISCSHGWVYNYSLFYPTITSQIEPRPSSCDFPLSPGGYLGTVVGRDRAQIAVEIRATGGGRT